MPTELALRRTRVRHAPQKPAPGPPPPVGPGVAPPREEAGLDWSDFIDLEARLDRFLAIGVNAAGYPIARPSDCRTLTLAFEASFERNLRQFETRHQETIRRYFELLERFKSSALQGYSAELARVEFLEARIFSTIGDPAAAAALIERWGDRPYRVDGNFKLIIEAFDLDLTARLVAGRIEEVKRLAIGRVLFLAAAGGGTRAFGLTRGFYPALSLGSWKDKPRHWVEPLLVAASRSCVWESEVGARPAAARALRWLVMMSATIIADLALLVASRLPRPTLPLQAGGDVGATPSPLAGTAGDMAPTILITRPTGGLGDLLMMTPGLRALARRYNRPVAFAIPRRFHHAFVGNPDIEILDCDAFIDLGRYARWRNLGLCPAARYEARHAPRIRKGRVELFARAMGVKRAELAHEGQVPRVDLTRSHQAIRQAVRELATDPKRPLIGLALHSREAYRDYPRMPELLVALAERFTVIAMHTSPIDLPASPHVIEWFGKPLDTTVAAIAACDALVSVDTALYHFAGALDVPAIAIFGPTSARVRSVHIRRSITVEAPGLPCRPCWRNEDERCQMSGGFDSVCMSSIAVPTILEAVDQALRLNPRQ